MASWVDYVSLSTLQLSNIDFLKCSIIGSRISFWFFCIDRHIVVVSMALGIIGIDG